MIKEISILIEELEIQIKENKENKEYLLGIIKSIKVLLRNLY